MVSTDSAMREEGRLRPGARQFHIVDVGTVIFGPPVGVRIWESLSKV